MPHFIKVFRIFLFTIALPNFVNAADWRPIGPSVYVDAGSIRSDYFSTQQTGGYFTMEPYTVVWLKFVRSEGDVMVEVVFNCRGGFEAMQQVVANETPNSQYHSFDNTQTLREIGRGARVKSIAPDSVYDTAQKFVCKPAIPWPPNPLAPK
jgi:hypothetical protein